MKNKMSVYTCCRFFILSMLGGIICTNSTWGEDEMDNPTKVISWNDDCRTIWEDSWSGPDIKRFFDPNIELVKNKYGIKVDDTYFNDTNKWLSVILKDKYIPLNMTKHAVAIKSHLIGAADVGDLGVIYRQRLEKLTLDSPMNPKYAPLDGIVVRFEMKQYVFLIIDQATTITVLVRDKFYQGNINPMDERIKFAWLIMADLFKESVLKRKGENAKFYLITHNKETNLVSASLNSADTKEIKDANGKPKSIFATLNDHFSGVGLLMPNGPVVKFVFYKIFNEKSPRAMLYFPRTRFEKYVLFDNQDFGGNEKHGFDRTTTSKPVETQPNTLNNNIIHIKWKVGDKWEIDTTLYSMGWMLSFSDPKMEKEKNKDGVHSQYIVTAEITAAVTRKGVDCWQIDFTPSEQAPPSTREQRYRVWISKVDGSMKDFACLAGVDYRSPTLREIDGITILSPTPFGFPFEFIPWNLENWTKRKAPTSRGSNELFITCKEMVTNTEREASVAVCIGSKVITSVRQKWDREKNWWTEYEKVTEGHKELVAKLKDVSNRNDKAVSPPTTQPTTQPVPGQPNLPTSGCGPKQNSETSPSRGGKQ